MDRGLDSKVVVVTGGAEGIGFAIADTFLVNGANVVILDINDLKGKETVTAFKHKYGQGRAEFIQCDVTKDVDRISKEVINKYKKVDVLVNNAGVLNENDLRKTFEVNSIAVIEWTVKFNELMRKDKSGFGGTVINIASIYGFIVDPYLVYYKASKFAVMGFTKCLGHADNYNRTGVRIVAICPGFTYSSMTSRAMAWDEHTEDFEKHIKTMPWQSIEAVGKATIEVFETADSGTAWMINGNDTIEQV